MLGWRVIPILIDKCGCGMDGVTVGQGNDEDCKNSDIIVKEEKDGIMGSIKVGQRKELTMPKRRYLELDEGQRKELEKVRNRHKLPHMREKAAVLLAIANGLSAHAAAASAGHRPHESKTVYGWLNRYQDGGIAALHVKSGRGRKPAFSP